MSKIKAYPIMTVLVTEKGKIIVQANKEDLPKDPSNLCSFLAATIDAIRGAYKEEESKIVELN